MFATPQNNEVQDHSIHCVHLISLIDYGTDYFIDRKIFARIKLF